ncbi:MAG TPA: inositol monophosphatase family protein [Candidatus Sulfopaludibacter sp.]|nr:inositol monophosphatase family protein [Candidatus Sulfopaludibacter sp.]
MKTVPLEPALAAATQAARAAGRLMYAHWHRPKRVKVAEAHDIKLELDVRCQQLIGKILRAAFPQIPLLGEEGDSGDVNAEYRWVVDPIDGTVNYFFGMPHAAVSIALQARSDKWQAVSDKKGNSGSGQNPVTCHMSQVTVLGVIYGPFTDELWTAVRGGPARLNGRIIHVSRRARLADAVIAMGFSKSQENLEKSLPHVNRLARRVRKIRIMGSAALELAYVASGRLDAYIERTINLWDVAAGALLIECAGGEFYALPAPGGKLRMCADNGLLRRKLQLGSLLR